jgi:opacity protein-like surface antigen
MRLSSAVPSVLLLLSQTLPAAAQDAGFYAKAFAGASALQGNSASVGGPALPLGYDTGAIYGGAVGYDYGSRPFRAELEFAYRTGDATGSLAGDFASTTFMLNGLYEFGGNGTFQPYVGAGLGYVTEIDFDVTAGPVGEYSDRGLLAGQVILGADYAVSDSLSLFGEARYFTTETPNLVSAGGGTLSADYDSFDLLAGVALRF